MIATNYLIPVAIIGGPVVPFALYLGVGLIVREYPITWRPWRRK